MKLLLVLAAAVALASCQNPNVAFEKKLTPVVVAPKPCCNDFGVRVMLYSEPQSYSIEYFNACDGNGNPQWQELVRYIEFVERWNPIIGNYDEAYAVAKNLRSMKDVDAYLANERKKVPNYPVRPKETRVY